MKRNIPDTSHEAYERVQPKISRKQHEVLEALKCLGGNATNHEIAAHLKWPIHTVTPRTGELRLMGKIVRGDKMDNGYKYKLVTTPVQLNLNLTA